MTRKLSITYGHHLWFSLFCVMLVIARVLLFHNANYLFLIWNLFLAWIPFQIAVFAWGVMEESLSQGQKGTLKDTTSLSQHNGSSENSSPPSQPTFFLLLLLLAWLAFFPNAPYIVTDFVHLRFISTNTPFLFWFQVTLFFFFSLGGLLYGVCSIELVQRILKKMMGTFWSWVVLITIFLLSGFGIYIGRFLRWNSWDILLNPLNLWSDLYENMMLSGFDYPFIITVVFAALIGLSYVFYRLAFTFQKRASSKTSPLGEQVSSHSQR